MNNRYAEEAKKVKEENKYDIADEKRRLYFK